MGQNPRNACDMTNAAACLEDLYEVIPRGKKVLEKKKPEMFHLD